MPWWDFHSLPLWASIALFAISADVVWIVGTRLAGYADFSLFGAILGIVLTTAYLIGLLHRRNPLIFRVGLDCLLVIVLYGAGLFRLFHIHDG